MLLLLRRRGLSPQLPLCWVLCSYCCWFESWVAVKWKQLAWCFLQCPGAATTHFFALPDLYTDDLQLDRSVRKRQRHLLKGRTCQLKRKFGGLASDMAIKVWPESKCRPTTWLLQSKQWSLPGKAQRAWGGVNLWGLASLRPLLPSPSLRIPVPGNCPWGLSHRGLLGLLVPGPTLPGWTKKLAALEFWICLFSGCFAADLWPKTTSIQ